MIIGITTALFLVTAPLIWRRGPDEAVLAYFAAVVVILITVVEVVATALIGFGQTWRVEAAFCGLLLTMAFVSLGILRS